MTAPSAPSPTAPLSTVPRLLERLAEDAPGRPVLAAGDETWDLSTLRDRTARAAGRLAAAGIGRGDRVALMTTARLEVVEVLLACAWAGVVAVPVNVALRGAQLEHVLRDSGARHVLVDAEFDGVLDGAELPPSLEGREIIGEHAGTGEPIERRDVRPGDVAAIIYTSGTTGPAKGVLITQGQLRWWGRNLADMLGAGPGDVLATCLPLLHINALATCLAAIDVGARTHLLGRFSASGFWRSMVETEATITFVIGPMAAILAHREAGPDDRAHRVRTALAPGTAPELHAAFKDRFGVDLVDAYGSTETNCVLGDPPGEGRPGWMGRPREGFHARVAAPDCTPLPPGTSGELLVRHDEPYAFASGYHGLPEATVKAWHDLWFHTGDLVVEGEDGRIRFVDRLRDAIRRRGENISAFDVEQALLTHPAVEGAAAFAVPSELGEDEVMAAVTLEDGRGVEPPELLDHGRQRLAAFAVPRYVEILDALPLTPTGRVQKAQLRRRGMTDATWDSAR